MDEAGTDAAQPERRRAPGWLRWLLGIGVAALALTPLVGTLIGMGEWGVPDFGPAPPPLIIDNRTDQELYLYGILDGQDRLADTIAPHTEGAVWGCANSLFVVRLSDGRAIDRKRTEEECEGTWVIKPSMLPKT